MAKKNRMYATPGEKKNPNHIATIEADEIRKMERNGRRKFRIILETRTGGGIHGEADKKSKHRADRRDGKLSARNWQKES